MRCLKILTVVLATFMAGMACAQSDTIYDEAEYKEEVISLFERFLIMQREGVFADYEFFKMWEAGQIEFPNDIRGDHKPGGFFARPPGSEWMKEMRSLLGSEVAGEGVPECITIPHNLRSNGALCGSHLILLANAIVFDESRRELNDLLRRFWLAKICYENRHLCPEL